MASQDSSAASPPPPQQQLHSHHSQQPLLLHHQHHHHQEQPPQHILMGPPPHQSDLTSYSNNIMPYQQQQQPELHPQALPRFPLNSVVTDGGAGEDSSSPPTGVGFSIETAKKKRGRPRKNPIDAEGASRVALGLSPVPGTPVKRSTVAAVMDSSGAQTSEKRRGRPPGSVKRQIDTLGSIGQGFTPHVIIVHAGEDVAAKIMEFTQQGPRNVCVMSANGQICNCTLRLPGLSNRTVTYEGKFEIITLLGSFMMSESTSGRVGGLSVMLSGSDGKVLGGGVAGMLLAAATVQIVVGSFVIQDVKKPKLMPIASPALIASAVAAAAAPNAFNDQAAFGGGDQVMAGASPPSGGGGSSFSSEDENTCETNNGGGGGGSYDNSGQQMQNIPMYGWESSKLTQTTFPDEF